jgi:hypothetical protein
MFSNCFDIFSASSKQIQAFTVVVFWMFETLEISVFAESLSQTWNGSTGFIFQLTTHEEIILLMLGE